MLEIIIDEDRNFDFFWYVFEPAPSGLGQNNYRQS